MIVSRVDGQFGNNLCQIVLGKYLANYLNTEFFINTSKHKIFIKEKNKHLFMDDDMGYSLVIKNYNNYNKKINDNFIIDKYSNVVDNLDKYDSNKDYFIKSPVIRLPDFYKKHNEFIKNELSWIYKDEFIDYINKNLINIDKLKECNILHLRVGFTKYRNDYLKPYNLSMIEELIKDKNTYIISDNYKFSSFYIFQKIKCDISKLNFILSPHFLYDFIILTLCKTIYTNKYTTFPILPNIIGDNEIYKFK